jgi:hypothetical protein
MRSHVRRLTAGMLTAVLLAACGGDPEDAELLQDPRAEEEAELEDDDEGTPIGDEPETDPAPESSSRGGDFLDVEAEVSQEHPGGVIIELRAVRFDGGAIVVDGEVRNDGDRDAVFPVTTEPERLRLVDDQGGTYDYVHPDDEAEETIEVPAGGTLEGPLAFVGPPDEDITTLRLVANVADPDAFDPDQRAPDTDRPEFVLDEMELDFIGD